MTKLDYPLQQTPTWKFIFDMLMYNHKPGYLLAIGYTLPTDRASKMFHHAVQYGAISKDDYTGFLAQLEKRE